MKEYYHDEKVGNRYILSPQEKKIRKEFVRKVTLIVIGQLFVTLSVTIPISFIEPARDRLNENSWMVIVSVFLMAVFTMFLVFCSWLARLILVNYSLIFLLTAFTAFWMTCLCAKYSHIKVAISIIITIFVSSALGMYAMYTSHDFTVILGVLLVVTLIALVLGVIYFLEANARLKWAILIGSVILTCVYLLSDVQMIIAGDRTFFLDMESHVLGACIMYIDFVYVFIYTLMIYGDFGGMKMNN